MKQVDPNNRTFNYPTRRVYDTPQVLEIEILSHTKDEHNFVTGSALFVDRSRHIAARVDIMSYGDTNADIGRAVLESYDSGEYYAKIFSHLAD